MPQNLGTCSNVSIQKKSIKSIIQEYYPSELKMEMNPESGPVLTLIVLEINKEKNWTETSI